MSGASLFHASGSNDNSQTQDRARQHESVAAGREITTIKPEEAAKYYDKQVSVKMTVQSSKLLKNQNLCFLNSAKDHRAADDFAVVLKEKALKEFTDLKVDDPAAYFKGKTITVTGKVEKYKDKPQIVVEKTDQIRIIVLTNSDSGGTSTDSKATGGTSSEGSGDAKIKSAGGGDDK